MRTIKEVLMERDGITAEEADVQIEEAKEAVLEYIDERDFEGAEEVCNEYFGLEPDYLMELMPI